MGVIPSGWNTVPSIRRLRKWVHLKTWEVFCRGNLSTCSQKWERCIPNIELSKKGGRTAVKVLTLVSQAHRMNYLQIISIYAENKLKRFNSMLHAHIPRSTMSRFTIFWIKPDRFSSTLEKMRRRGSFWKMKQLSRLKVWKMWSSFSIRDRTTGPLPAPTWTASHPGLMPFSLPISRPQHGE